MLNLGESLRVDKTRSEGFMQERDIYDCSVIDSNGIIIGKVRVTDHTAVRGFRRTISMVQTDTGGNIVRDESWTT